MEWLTEYDPHEFTKHGTTWFLVSLVVLLISAGWMAYNNSTIGEPLQLGIDFIGGTMVQLEFDEPQSTSDIAEIATEYSERDPMVQSVQTGGEGEGGNVYQIRLKVPVPEDLTTDEQNQQISDQIDQMREEITSQLGEHSLTSQQTVGPTISSELIRKAIVALLFGSLVVLLYIFIRFSSIIFAFGAIIALLHDVFITLGLAAVLRIEIDAAFIAVVLTIIGYSINDSIVIYDRIRENLRNFPTMFQDDVIDLSLTQTLQRSINTSGTTLAVLLALFFFGGHSIRDFVAALAIGVASGTYSSIFIASPFVEKLTGEQDEREYTFEELSEEISEKTAKKRKSGETGSDEEEEETEQITVEQEEDEPESIKAPGAEADEDEDGDDTELLDVEIEDDEEDN